MADERLSSKRFRHVAQVLEALPANRCDHLFTPRLRQVSDGIDVAEPLL
jgi:hypothetical protein